jgi:glutaminyl-tRNA synthetase
MSEPAHSPAAGAAAPADFIRDIVAAHVAGKRYPKIVTRFPPEPNGYLHLGHAKSICLNFGIALENNGACNLRMDDTNPAKEEDEYVQSIITDVRWLISGWADHVLAFHKKNTPPKPVEAGGKLDAYAPPADPGAPDAEPFFASDYFDALHAFAVRLIQKGKAYVCDLTPAETDAYRGAPDQPGKPSPYRDRSVAENLDLFNRMRNGEFPDGARTLRAKIDMASPNIWLRDPLLYRIRHTAHHHAGAGWCIYPLYDFAHCISDYIEGITHSICTLEFEVHRPLYDWILDNLDLPRPLPHQYEFAKLNLAYTIFSKRRLLKLVKDKYVNGWDDPRLPTLSGLRRRGVPPAALRNFAYNIGVTKYDSLTELAVFENAVRDELNRTAQRRLAVLRPLKVVLGNIAEGEVIDCEAPNHPANPALGARKLPLTREVYIERDDFAEIPPPKYHRLKPGGEVRLKYACIIRLDRIIKNEAGEVTELHCTAQLDTRAGQPNSGKKVKGTVHWVSATSCRDAEVRLYENLFLVPDPGADAAVNGPDAWLNHLNPNSLQTITAKIEPGLSAAKSGESYQFERLAYFTPDPKDSTPEKPVFNRVITLKDTWTPKH